MNLFVRCIRMAVCFATCSFVINVFGQETNSTQLSNEVLVSVGGDVERPFKVGRVEWSKFSRLSVQTRDHDGKESKFEGVRLGDILQKAGVKFGKDLRDKALAAYLLVEAADGYQAVFALPELDSAFTERVILLADRCDGRPLSEKAGPLQIIVPHEKRHARWVRQVKTLTVQRADVVSQPKTTK